MQRILRPSRQAVRATLLDARVRISPQWRPHPRSELKRCASTSDGKRRLHTVVQSPPQPGKHDARPKYASRSLKLPLTLALIMTGGIAFYLGQLLVAARSTCPGTQVVELAQQADVAARYDTTANSYDAEVGLSEWLMGILSLRKRLAKSCKGHVLEVSCGTGRNLGYFDVYRGGEVESLTFVDLSPQMVDLCKKKWLALYGGSSEKKLKPGLVIRFLTASALSEMPLAPTDKSGTQKKYDTIVQTMGLCSTPNPGDLLRNMASHLDTANPDARIYLLEHGRSYREWLNNILDSSAAKHAELHGCWFNRDIGQIVSDAAQDCGLEIVRERRHHIGTTWSFELRAKETVAPSEVESDKAAQPSGISVPPRNSWTGWIFGSSSSS